MARHKRKSEFAGLGCMLQFLGLVLLFWFPIGTIIGVGLLLYGSAAAIKLICSACGNPVVKTSKICPTCHAPFDGSD